MILVQTPLRVSFVGGGTDFKEYYTRCDGSVISAAIDKYVYVMVKKRFDDDIRVVYSNTEMVKSVDDIEHDLVREALRKTGVEKGVEIATFADIPSEGCGLGSSSAITIGLLNALYAYAGIRKTSEQLALEACNIEIDILKRPIGKQDQYIAAYGGIRHIVFRVDDTVEVNDLVLSKSSLKLLEERLLLLYTGMTRKSSEILTEQKEKMGEHFTMLDQMNGLVPQLRESMLNGVGTEFGRLLDENWRLKKQLASKISNSDIDECYERTLQAGATGGKICGAGGGGFLLLYCTPEKRGAVTEAAKPMREVKFRFERCGSTVLLDGRR
jgi:D-glycero-alpha-D-manno-heptose-7-phosphate kinase